jgi:hypothetical protein
MSSRQLALNKASSPTFGVAVVIASAGVTEAIVIAGGIVTAAGIRSKSPRSELRDLYSRQPPRSGRLFAFLGGLKI